MTLHKVLLLSFGVISLAACSSNSGGSSAASAAAASVITFTAVPSTVAAGGTSIITFSGGTNSFQNAYASQGSVVQQSPTTFLYTAPASPTSSTVTIQVSDTAGLGGMGGLFLSGVTSTPGTGGTTSPGTIIPGGSTVSSCAGSYSVNAGGVGAVLGIVQNVAGQISGYLYFPANSVNTQPYTYPIWGTCSGGSISFQNVSLGQTYSGSYSGGTISGNIQTSAGTFGFSGSATQLSAAPVAETMACGGTYSANIAGTGGTLYLVHNGGGGVAGYLTLPYGTTTNIYSITGTCGGSISFTNNTNGSSYTGTATFNGASVSMNGTFTTAGGQQYGWSASK